jgi:cell division protein FtsL
LTEHNRIETMVKKQLDMHRPGPDEEIVVRIK